jgi:hypothetical protein
MDANIGKISGTEAMFSLYFAICMHRKRRIIHKKIKMKRVMYNFSKMIFFIPGKLFSFETGKMNGFYTNIKTKSYEKGNFRNGFDSCDEFFTKRLCTG